MKYKEALYVGCGNKEVTFKSNDPAKPAKFYINSAPAYKQFITQLITTDAKLQKANPRNTFWASLTITARWKKATTVWSTS